MSAGPRIEEIAGRVLWKPNPGPQGAFLLDEAKEVLYGGAAGGGKSDALLIAAIEHSKCQFMRSVIFRRTFPEMKDLVRRSKELYPATGARYRESTKEWFFPSGGIVEFGYLDKDKDKFNYSGRAFTFIGWDELTRWKNDTFYRFMMSRLRASKTARKTIRVLKVRSTTNPGGPGHLWVKERFGIDDAGSYTERYEPKTDSWIVFRPAKIKDNPFLADTSYEQDLEALPDHLKRMLKEGRWDLTEGVMFTEWDRRIHVVEPFAIPRGAKLWRSCDDGYNAPACVLWFAKVDMRVYVFAELYRAGLVAEELGEIVQKRDMNVPIADDDGTTPLGRTLDGIIDSAAFSDTGVRRFRSQSRAKIMNEMGLRWKPSHKGKNSRVQGCNEVHSMLRGKLRDGLPKLQVFCNCKNLIRTLPAVPIDELNMEDVDTDSEDHAYDSLRYGLQGIPQVVERRKLSGT